MGEKSEAVHIIGSPDIDIMFSRRLPSKTDVLEHYGIPFDDYAVLAYHPVTSEPERLRGNIRVLVGAVIDSGLNYVVIYPNNDPGSEVIIREYERLARRPRFRVFPSVQFEKFLVLLKNARFIIGNSSSGIREAPIYAVPTINLGSRQNNRFEHESIFNVEERRDAVLKAIRALARRKRPFRASDFFGKGNSVKKFTRALEREGFWRIAIQKQFRDL
jgi:UDP-N-acetylglucosamine 2-epimerase (hydrolysing)